MVTVNPLDMANKNIIVTGASAGIGRESAVLLSKLGANITLISRNEEKLLETKELLEGENHSIVTYDFSNVEGITGLIDRVVSQHGRICGLVHSAGIQVTLPLNMTSVDEMIKVFNINFFSFFELVKAISRKKCFAENCSLVAISSAAALAGRPGLSAYGASKAALNNLVKTLALELAKKKIRVNSISPAFVNTPMLAETKSILHQEQIHELEKRQPLGFGEPIDVANAAAFLLSDASKWITGISLNVDGGFSAT